MMRISLSPFVLSLLIACNRGNDAPLRAADGSLVSNAGGDVALSDGTHLQFVITSDRYKQWDAARRGLDAAIAKRFGQLLQPKTPTRASIDKAVAFLEGNAVAKQGIERAGMTVRDFVLMTVALEQEMRLASGQANTQPARAPDPAPAPIDPSQIPAYAPVEPPPADTLRSTPTVDTAPRPTLPRDSVRRDSVGRRATPRPDSVPKPPRDTSNDTTRAAVSG